MLTRTKSQGPAAELQFATKPAPGLKFEALVVLRAIFDLTDVTVWPTIDLLARLLGLPPVQVSALVAQLRHCELVQRDRLSLTFGGLAVAAGLPQTELQPMTASASETCAA